MALPAAEPGLSDIYHEGRSPLCLFADVITFAIYRWERKNIATCGHYRTWAAILERDHFKLPMPARGARAPDSYPRGQVTAPAFLRQSWGKTQAEALLYRAVIISWLAAGICTAVR